MPWEPTATLPHTKRGESRVLICMYLASSNVNNLNFSRTELLNNCGHAPHTHTHTRRRQKPQWLDLLPGSEQLTHKFKRKLHTHTGATYCKACMPEAIQNQEPLSFPLPAPGKTKQKQITYITTHPANADISWGWLHCNISLIFRSEPEKAARSYFHRCTYTS